MSNKHIVLVAPGFAKDESDTTCIPALQLYVKELMTRDVQITIISLNYPFHENEYYWNNVKVISLGGKNSWFKKKFVLKNQLFKTIHKLHQTNKIDVLHSFWLNETTLFTAKVATKLNIPLVANAMGQDVKRDNTSVKSLQNYKHTLVAISEFQAFIFKHQSLKFNFVIPWGIEDFPHQNKSIDIVGVGNLIPLKNFTYYIQLVAEVSKVHPGLKTVIIGDGPERNKLEELVNEYQLQDIVSILGSVNYHDTQKYIAEAKVLLHPSDFEGFGLIFAEAMRNQTHVLSQKVGIMYEHQTEFLSLEIEKDAELLIQLLMKEKPPVFIYSIKDTTDKYLQIYHGL